MSIWEHLDEIDPALLVVVGFVMLVVPEPATSTLGAGLMLFGAAWWFQQWQ